MTLLSVAIGTEMVGYGGVAFPVRMYPPASEAILNHPTQMHPPRPSTPACGGDGNGLVRFGFLRHISGLKNGLIYYLAGRLKKDSTPRSKRRVIRRE